MSVTPIKLGESVHLDAPVSGSAGAAMDADSVPTVVVFEDDNDTPILSLAMTKRGSLTGKYRRKVDFTSGNGFEVGKSYNVYVDGTIAGQASHKLRGTFIVRAVSIDDLALAATALSTAQWTNTRAGLLDFLDALISSRAPSSTALSNVQWTNGRAALLDFLDAAISGRAPAATALSNAQWTNGRAALLDFLDAAISGRAPAATALSNAQWTNGRAAALDFLDAAISGRAPAATALSNAQWTNARAAFLDFLDALTEDVGGRRFKAHALTQAPGGGGGGGAPMPRLIKSKDRTVRR